VLPRGLCIGNGIRVERHALGNGISEGMEPADKGRKLLARKGVGDQTLTPMLTKGRDPTWNLRKCRD